MRNSKAMTMTVASLFAMGIATYSSLAHAAPQKPAHPTEAVTSAAAEVSPEAARDLHKNEEQQQAESAPAMDSGSSKSAHPSAASKSAGSAHQ